MARRRFFVDWIRNGEAEIAGENAHHLARVLRVQPGQTFEISDGEEAWVATVHSVSKSAVRFTLETALDPVEPLAATDLYLALVKFDRFEWAVEKATELGVTKITPVATQRSESGLLEAANKRVDRWRKIAREASEQSRRVSVPIIEEPRRLARLGAPDGKKILLDELPGASPFLAVLDGLSRDGAVSLLIGPEGGWVAEERSSLLDAGWVPASVGPLILRTETAVCAALATLVAYRAA